MKISYAIGSLDLTDKKIFKSEVSLVDTLNDICQPLPTIYKDDFLAESERGVPQF